MDINFRKRIWLDSLTANSGLSTEVIDNLILNGYAIVTSNAAVDINIFQMNQDWLESNLEYGNIIIEIWHTPDEMVHKEFFWSSCSQMTSPAATLEDAIENLPNAADILDVADLVDIYGIPKGEWTAGPWAPPAPFSHEAASKLGLNAETATRTDVLAAAQNTNQMKLFDEFNAAYNAGLAMQHYCLGIINTDGSVTNI